jgi:hypothetical protein
MKISRDVITDLWPLVEAGDASADTRELVEQFLAADPELAAKLRARLTLPSAATSLPADAQISALARTRDLVYGRSWLRGIRLAALVLTIFAGMRLLADTTWTNPPRMFIVDAVLAVVLWSLYCLLLRRYRTRALRASIFRTPPQP